MRSSTAMGFSGTDQVKIVPGDAGYVLEDVPHFSDFIPDLPGYKNITSRREMGSGRSMAISTRFTFSLFLLALVILSDVIMVANGLENCRVAANKDCCKGMDNYISRKSCSALCGIRHLHRIDNGLIRKCYEVWKCLPCKECKCP